MKFSPLNIQNLKIAVYQSDGTEFPVVLLHASSIGAASFYKQMMSKEGEQLRFISIDLPGHGASDFSFKPEEYYSFDKLSELMIDTINELNLGKFILVGHFLGAHIALNISNKLSNITGLVLTGFSPLKNYTKWGKAYNTDETFNYIFQGKINSEEAARLAQIFFSEEVVADISFVDNIKNTDPNFRKHLTDSFKNISINDFELLENNKIPTAVILGEKDRIVNIKKFDVISEKLWRKKVQIISESGNSPMWENPKTFNYLITEFIKDLI